MPDIRYRGRFAPSPTGPLHAGSMLAALGSWLLARQAGGEWLVRIEDLDPPREVAGAAEAQLATLAAFGLRHDGDIAWQSRRGAHYQAALDRHESRGGHYRSDYPQTDGAAVHTRVRIPHPAALEAAE